LTVIIVISNTPGCLALSALRKQTACLLQISPS